MLLVNPNLVCNNLWFLPGGRSDGCCKQDNFMLLKKITYLVNHVKVKHSKQKFPTSAIGIMKLPVLFEGNLILLT